MFVSKRDGPIHFFAFKEHKELFNADPAKCTPAFSAAEDYRHRPELGRESPFHATRGEPFNVASCPDYLVRECRCEVDYYYNGKKCINRLRS